MSTERDELAAIISAHDDYWPDHVAELILAAGYRKPRQVTTAAELDALHVGSVVLDQSGTAWNKTGVRIWWVRGVTIIGGNPAELLPATVIHEGGPDA